MLLKIMSAEDAPDSDPRKMFKMFDHVSTCEFIRNSGKVRADVMFNDESCEAFDVPANAYLMNADGVTVGSVGSMPYRK